MQQEQSKNMRLIGHSMLDGFGNGGEGFGLKQLSDGRRILFVAHESGPKDFTVLDVTRPAEPKVIAQIDLPHGGIRSNSLALVDDILLVAYQAGLNPFATTGVARPGVGVNSSVVSARFLQFQPFRGRGTEGDHDMLPVSRPFAQ